MRCWRVDLQRKSSRYLNGELAPREINRLEDHLLDCGYCRARLARLREAHRFAGQLPREASQRDPWHSIEAAIVAGRTQPAVEVSAAEAASRWRAAVSIPRLAGAVALIGSLLIGAVFFLSRESPPEPDATALLAEAFESIDFHRVKISDIQHNTEPHVVAEGYVSEIRIDHDDGDLVFKLVDDMRQSQPFIVCEILNPKKLSPPHVGTRVRVYGVSRYDNQENHNWYEVHPVLNIELVR